jgi:tryptophanyl-tRNA synthetase
VSTRLDPWGHYAIEDYEKLMEEFGITPIEKLLTQYIVDHFYFTRRVIFGHRDLDLWLNMFSRGEKTACPNRLYA